MTRPHTSLRGGSLPPRYAIESDSEDSDFEDPDELSEAPKVVRASKASTSREPGLAFSAALPKGNALILAIDRAGEIWSKGLQAFDELAALTVDGEQARPHALTAKPRLGSSYSGQTDRIAF